MTRIFLAAVDVIPAAVVLVPLFLILHVSLYRRNPGKSVLYCLFCIYLSAIFSLVGIPNVTYFRPQVNLNLIPFLGILDDVKNSFLNILLFIPLGFFLPVLWTRFRRFAFTVFFGLGLSLAVELLQMLTFRATDVNDLITNVLGTALGFLLAKPIISRYSAISNDEEDVYRLCMLSFGIMFFLHPFLSPMIWDRIL